MSKFVTGYQYGTDNQFIGEYSIPAYDEIDLVLPPNTTLIKPPVASDQQEAIWNGKKWNLKDKKI